MHGPKPGGAAPKAPPSSIQRAGRGMAKAQRVSRRSAQHYSMHGPAPTDITGNHMGLARPLQGSESLGIPPEGY